MGYFYNLKIPWSDFKNGDLSKNMMVVMAISLRFKERISTQLWSSTTESFPQWTISLVSILQKRNQKKKISPFHKISNFKVVENVEIVIKNVIPSISIWRKYLRSCVKVRSQLVESFRGYLAHHLWKCEKNVFQKTSTLS